MQCEPTASLSSVIAQNVCFYFPKKSLFSFFYRASINHISQFYSKLQQIDNDKTIVFDLRFGFPIFFLPFKTLWKPDSANLYLSRQKLRSEKPSHTTARMPKNSR